MTVLQMTVEKWRITCPPIKAPLLTRRPQQTTQQKKVHSRKYAIPIAELTTEMAKLLRDVKVFFTKDINLERKGSPISPSTWTKANERILCYLGFCRDTLHYKDISPDLFLRTRLLERYLDYLKTDRKLASSTLAGNPDVFSMRVDFSQVSNKGSRKTSPIMVLIGMDLWEVLMNIKL
ncbi:uncharacterized protein LOC116611798 [Nematostella vectensis]|uniref:uncharacterized protein LOC116611798 n=1 Tax=Nematostella vectensis TaxID=45351 RepID=UPI00207798F0|nr:uncharacterized protein LOC116611798 [Nematostella vectensis]